MNLITHCPPAPSVFIKMTSSLDGRIIDVRHEPAHSWVRNFYNNFYALSLGIFNSGSSWGAGYLSMRSTDGTYRSPNRYDAACFLSAAANDSNAGILTGRGSNAVSINDYALQTPITHGTGTNQLSHRAQADAVPSYTAGTKTWAATISRLFDNNSPATITVSECGLVGATFSSSWKNLLCRDILSSPIDVLVSGTLTVSYSISLLFPD